MSDVRVTAAKLNPRGTPRQGDIGRINGGENGLVERQTYYRRARDVGRMVHDTQDCLKRACKMRMPWRTPSYFLPTCLAMATGSAKAVFRSPRRSRNSDARLC
ncbi:MAG: hypothetical protein IT492_14355 [Gammaproteobacteria bacterium]|nr:hypothetical protein [Gammaproteobacteria bacterium]